MLPSNQRKDRYPAKPAEAYFFGTCLVDNFFPEAGLAAVELMEREGVRVLFPQGQTCCGQPPFNSGYREEARSVARGQMALFFQHIPIVVPSGSCASMLRNHYPRLFEGEGGEKRAGVAAFSERVFEWSEFMVRVLGVQLLDSGPPIKVTYHPSCHLMRDMAVEDAPLELLGQLDGVELVPLPEAEECCGFGGTFSVKQSDISWAMVEDKRRSVAESGADVLISADCGCLMHIGGAMAKAGQKTRVSPLSQFIEERTHESQR